MKGRRFDKKLLAKMVFEHLITIITISNQVNCKGQRSFKAIHFQKKQAVNFGISLGFQQMIARLFQDWCWQNGRKLPVANTMSSLLCDKDEQAKKFFSNGESYSRKLWSIWMEDHSWHQVLPTLAGILRNLLTLFVSVFGKITDQKWIIWY